MIKPGLAWITFASFKRPAIIVGFCLEIIVLMSPAGVPYSKAAPVDIAMMTMLVGPLYLILNSILKDSVRHLVMKTRLSRRQLILLINATSFALAGTLAISTASVYLVRLWLAGYIINLQDFLGYICFGFLFLFLIGSIHNLLCEILSNRLIAFFITLLPIIVEYFSASFPDAFRFIFAYQAVSNIYKYLDFSIYFFLLIIAELMLFLSCYISREVIDR